MNMEILITPNISSINYTKKHTPLCALKPTEGVILQFCVDNEQKQPPPFRFIFFIVWGHFSSYFVYIFFKKSLFIYSCRYKPKFNIKNLTSDIIVYLIQDQLKRFPLQVNDRVRNNSCWNTSEDDHIQQIDWGGSVGMSNSDNHRRSFIPCGYIIQPLLTHKKPITTRTRPIKGAPKKKNQKKSNKILDKSKDKPHSHRGGKIHSSGGKVDHITEKLHPIK